MLMSGIESAQRELLRRKISLTLCGEMSAVTPVQGAVKPSTKQRTTGRNRASEIFEKRKYRFTDTTATAYCSSGPPLLLKLLSNNKRLFRNLLLVLDRRRRFGSFYFNLFLILS